MTVRFYEVGGCVRDRLLGQQPKDVDFAVEAPSFSAMRETLLTQGFKVYLEKEEFLTIRAGVPEGHPLRQRTKDADFVLCRKDGVYKDGRRPETVTPGTILDDLARRDFTVNAMAMDEEGNLLDPHGGEQDLKQCVLAFVGDPLERIREDGLRVMRGLRFYVTKGLIPDHETWADLTGVEAADMLAKVSKERVREELEKMLAHDSEQSFKVLMNAWRIRDAVFSKVRLSAKVL